MLHCSMATNIESGSIILYICELNGQLYVKWKWIVIADF